MNNKIKIALVTMLFSILSLAACSNEYTGCEDGFYPYEGDCVKGCPSGTRLVVNECKPYRLLEDGDTDSEENESETTEE